MFHDRSLLGRCFWGFVLPVLEYSHIGILIRRFAAEPGSTAGLIPLSMSLWNDFPDSVFDGVGLSREQGQCFFIGLSCSIPTIVFYSFSLSFYPIKI